MGCSRAVLRGRLDFFALAGEARRLAGLRGGKVKSSLGSPNSTPSHPVTRGPAHVRFADSPVTVTVAQKIGVLVGLGRQVALVGPEVYDFANRWLPAVSLEPQVPAVTFLSPQGLGTR